jgi:hypothetical protein
MAQIKEVLEIEYKREVKEDYLVIHLFEEGTFYRAYQMSYNLHGGRCPCHCRHGNLRLNSDKILGQRNLFAV